MKKRITILIVIIAMILIFLGIYSLKNLEYTDTLLEYKYVGKISENIVSISDGEKYGYIDINGNIIFSLDYNINSNYDIMDQINNLKFTNGIAPYYTVYGYGIIDNKGNILIDASFESINIINKNTIIACSDSSCNLINSNGDILTNSSYNSIEYDENSETDNTLIAILNDKYGLISLDGTELLEFKYNYINKYYSNNEYIYVLDDGSNLEILDKNLEKITLNSILEFIWFSDNMICYLDNNNLINILNINTLENQIMSNSYTYVGVFNDGMAVVVNNNSEIGYINESYDLVIDFNYQDGSSNFNNGFAIVVKDSKYGVINTEGLEIINCVYDEIEIVNSNIFIVYQDGSAYIINSNEEILIDNYDTIESINNGEYYIVMKDNKYGVLDNNYNIIYNINYNDIKYSDNHFILEVDGGFYIK